MAPEQTSEGAAAAPDGTGASEEVLRIAVGWATTATVADPDELARGVQHAGTDAPMRPDGGLRMRMAEEVSWRREQPGARPPDVPVRHTSPPAPTPAPQPAPAPAPAAAPAPATIEPAVARDSGRARTDTPASPPSPETIGSSTLAAPPRTQRDRSIPATATRAGTRLAAAGQVAGTTCLQACRQVAAVVASWTSTIATQLRGAGVAGAGVVARALLALVVLVLRGAWLAVRPLLAAPGRAVAAVARSLGSARGRWSDELDRRRTETVLEQSAFRQMERMSRPPAGTVHVRAAPAPSVRSLSYRGTVDRR